MNFKFTLKSTAIFLAGLVLAAVVGTAFDSPMSGLIILIGTVAWLAQSQAA